MLRAFALLIVIAACSHHADSTATAPDAATPDARSGFQPGSHDPFPQIPNNGGAILDHVELVTITFADDPHEATLGGFSSWLTTSTWWTEVGMQYGVGAGTQMHIHLADLAPSNVNDTDIQTFIANDLANGMLPKAPEALYMVYYPPQTTVDLAVPCSGFDNMDSQAYHNSTGASGFRYAVVPSCSEESLANIELGAAHEAIEAATDADPLIAPAWQFTSGPWIGEVADECDQPYVENGYTVPTVWSNAAAASGGDPCVPAPANELFFDASVMPASAVIAAGQSATFDVRGWSTAPEDMWMLTAEASPGSPGFTPTMDLGAHMLGNGESTTLVVDVPASAQAGSTATVYVVDELGPNGSAGYHWWPVVVTAM